MWEFGKWIEVHQEAAGKGDWLGRWAEYEEEMIGKYPLMTVCAWPVMGTGKEITLILVFIGNVIARCVPPTELDLATVSNLPSACSSISSLECDVVKSDKSVTVGRGMTFKQHIHIIIHNHQSSSTFYLLYHYILLIILPPSQL